MVLGLRAAAPVLNVFMLAIVIAQTLAPFTQWLLKKKVPAVWAAVISVLLVIVAGSIVTTLLAGSAARLAAVLPSYENGMLALKDQVIAWLASHGIKAGEVFEASALDPRRLIALVTAFATGMAAIVAKSVLIVLLVAFMLLDVATLSTPGAPQARSLFWMKEASTFGGDIREYVRLTAFAALLTASGNFVALLFFKVPLPFTWAVLSFFLTFIPVVGFMFGMILPALVALIELGTGAMVGVIIAYIVVNFIVDNIIKPHFIKQGFSLSFIEVFFSLLFWGWVFGPVGTILAIPLTLTVMKLRGRLSPG